MTKLHDVKTESSQFIVVEGPIGVGKTSLAKKLSESLSGTLILEDIDNNPFLDRFWQRKFMHGVLDDDLVNTLPLGAPGLNRFNIGSFLKDKFWFKTFVDNIGFAIALPTHSW